MTGRNNGGITIPCPKCASRPLNTTTGKDDQVRYLDEFIGRQCVHCGYTVLRSDIDVATIAALENLLLDRFSRQKR